MKVKLAAQILSNTVSAVLRLLSESVTHQENSKEILETAEIVKDLDRHFDCTNGPSSRTDIKKDIRENVKKKQLSSQTLDRIQKKIKNPSYFKIRQQFKTKKH